jgi:acyl carrier protein
MRVDAVTAVIANMSSTEPLETQVKAAIVRCLKMPISPEEIADDMPLFGQGLGLDSIDALELVLELQRSFNVAVSDEQMGQRVLRNVRSIVEFITEQRAQQGSSSAQP